MYVRTSHEWYVVKSGQRAFQRCDQLKKRVISCHTDTMNSSEDINDELCVTYQGILPVYL